MGTSAADALLSVLVDAQLGVAGQTLFANREPDMPKTQAAVAVLYDAPGEPPEYTQDSARIAITTSRVRVAVRCRSYGPARELIDAIYPLMQQAHAVIGDEHYEWIGPLSDPYMLPPDENDRIQLGFTVRAKHHP